MTFISQSDPKVGKSWIIYDHESLPRRCNFARYFKVEGKREFMNVQHKGGDTFTAFPITFWNYLKLKLHGVFHA